MMGLIVVERVVMGEYISIIYSYPDPSEDNYSKFLEELLKES